MFNLGDAFMALQAAQHRHDERFHRDIAVLVLHPRLNHMALHFAKYTGKIAATTDPDKLCAIFTDVLIIALSTANICNANLYSEELPSLWGITIKGYSDVLREQVRSRLHGRERLEFLDGDGLRHSGVLARAAIASGMIADACEKIDHLEGISVRRAILCGVGEYAQLALIYLATHDRDPEQMIRDRWATIETKLRGIPAVEAA